MTPLETLQQALGDRYSFERELGSKDDNGFLMIAPVGQAATDKMVVVDNWFDGLKRSAKK